MFVNVAPSTESAPETLCSLRFAAKVRGRWQAGLVGLALLRRGWPAVCCMPCCPGKCWEASCRALFGAEIRAPTGAAHHAPQVNACEVGTARRNVSTK